MGTKATGLNGTPAATLTTTNADGTDIDVVSGTAVFASSPAPIEGTTCITGTGYTIFFTSTQTKGLTRIYLYVTGTITVDSTISTHYYAAGQVASTMLISAGNKLRLTTKGDGTTTTRWSDTTNFPSGQWVRLEHWTDTGTTTSNGNARVALYDVPTSTTPRSGSDSASAGSNVNTGGTGGTLYTTRISGSSNWALDGWGLKDGADAATFTPWPLVGPPVVNQTGTTGYMVDFTASTGVEPFDYALSWVSGPNHLVDVEEPVTGVFIIPLDTLGPSVYSIRVTDANALYTDADVNVPTAATAGESFQVLYAVSGVLV